MRVFLWSFKPGRASSFATAQSVSLGPAYEVLSTTDLHSSLLAALSGASESYALLVNIDFGFSQSWSNAADELVRKLPQAGWAVVSSAGYSPLAGILDSATLPQASNSQVNIDVVLPLSNVEPGLLLLNRTELQDVSLGLSARGGAEASMLSFELVAAGKAMLWSAALGCGGTPVRRIAAPGRFAPLEGEWFAKRSRTTLIKTATRDFVISHAVDALPLATSFDVEREGVRLGASVLDGGGTLRIALVFAEEPSTDERKRLDITRRAFEIAAGNIETDIVTTQSYLQAPNRFDWAIPMAKGSWVMSQAATHLRGALLAGGGYNLVTFGAIAVREGIPASQGPKQGLTQVSKQGSKQGSKITDHRFAEPIAIEAGAFVFRTHSESAAGADFTPRVSVSVPLVINPGNALNRTEAAQILGLQADSLVLGSAPRIMHEPVLNSWLRRLSYNLLDVNNYRRALRIFNVDDLRRLWRKFSSGKRSPNRGGATK
jgi:hypothetical protein